MKTTYLKKQHERALFYLECIVKVMDRIVRHEMEQREYEKAGTEVWWKHPFYDKKEYDKGILKDIEFSIYLMKRYETVLDNINSHSYAK